MGASASPEGGLPGLPPLGPFPTSIPGVTGFPDMALPEGPNSTLQPSQTAPVTSMLPPGTTPTTVEGFPAPAGQAPFEIGPQAIPLPQGGVLVPQQFPDGATFSLPPSNVTTTPIPGMGGLPANVIPFPVVGGGGPSQPQFVSGPNPTFGGVPIGVDTSGSPIPTVTGTTLSPNQIAGPQDFGGGGDPTQGAIPTQGGVDFTGDSSATVNNGGFPPGTTVGPEGQIIEPDGTTILPGGGTLPGGVGTGTLGDFFQNFLNRLSDLFTRGFLVILGIVLLGIAVWFLASKDARATAIATAIKVAK